MKGRDLRIVLELSSCLVGQAYVVGCRTFEEPFGYFVDEEIEDFDCVGIGRCWGCHIQRRREPGSHDPCLD